MLLAETELERIVIVTSDGNHGRTTEKIRVATRTEHSYEHALYLQLADDLRDEPRVSMTVSRSQLTYVPIYDQTIRFTHGDAVRFGGGVGGITIPINKAIAQWDQSVRADLTCMGHWHQLTWGSRVVVNGSLIGFSPYSVAIKAGFEPARQAFFLLDSRRGICQQTPLWVRDDDHTATLHPEASRLIRERIAAGEGLPEEHAQ
jgi:hypothetical protein